MTVSWQTVVFTTAMAVLVAGPHASGGSVDVHTPMRAAAGEPLDTTVFTTLAVRPDAPVTRLAASQPPAPEQQDEFVPISELPPQERLPAAPLLIAAYVFVLAVLFVYVMLVARRLTALQRDVARLEGNLAKRGRG